MSAAEATTGTMQSLSEGADLENVRSRPAGAIAQTDRFCRLGQVFVDHAFFGPMSHTDWMRWGYLHTDHHLRQFGR